MNIYNHKKEISLNQWQKNLEIANDIETERVRAEIAGIKQAYTDKYGPPDVVEGLSHDGVVRRDSNTAKPNS
ncbi:MAG: hypothetical protein H6797_04320 [Candidatus Nomurabacteria bacterium]|nr:MAG: hypothetical protein H6797_04320 [Candidatus Nomurabacteria bacterium]